MKETHEIRCGICNKLLGKGIALDMEIKCPRCKAINHVRAQSPSNAGVTRSEPQEGQSERDYDCTD